MSAGHRHHQEHDPAIVSQTRKYLAMPQISGYLARPYSTDFSHRIPYTGGSSADGRIYYVDPDVPAALRRFVVWHERVEKALRDELRMSYDRAHRIATCAERLMVEAEGHSWEAYKRAVGKPVRINEAHKDSNMPPGFDYGPYFETNKMSLVS
jgi:hypothetical protein